MSELPLAQPPVAPDVVAAQEEAEAALADVKERLEALHESSALALRRATRAARPLLVGAAVGVVVLTVILATRQRASDSRRLRRAEARALLGAALKFALITAARTALRHLVVRAVEEAAERSLENHRGVPPTNLASRA